MDRDQASLMGQEHEGANGIAGACWGRASPDWRVLRFPDGSVAARVDVERGLLEIQKRGEKQIWDLVQVVEDPPVDCDRPL